MEIINAVKEMKEISSQARRIEFFSQKFLSPSTGVW